MFCMVVCLFHVGKYADDTGLHDAYMKRLESSFVDNTQYNIHVIEFTMSNVY